MSFISNNIYNFIYIAVIILGGVTLTLTIILRAKERDKRHRAMMFFVGAIFIYMILDFITYYYLGENISGDIVFALITVSDILFCLLVVAWVYLIIVLISIENEIRMRWVVAVSVIYQIASQILSVSLGRYDSYALHVEGGLGKTILQILNAAYVLIIILIGVKCIMLLLRKYQKSKNRNVNLILVLLLIGYMLWIAYWDYSTWYKTEENLISIYAVDPLILLYAIFNVALIYYFYKKDPLKLTGTRLASEDAVARIAERCELSVREKEVLELMNCGMSNAQIAAELTISENTVKRHANSIFRKTDANGRHELLYKISNER